MAEIKNLKKVASRILKAIKNQEKIILYGDADLDGVSAVIILKETIRNLGGGITAIYFPDRETEGYGISEKGLESLKKFAPALFIALDCGIGNFREIKQAKKLGFKVIIIDHHQILDKLPEAEIIVDPKQPGDKYPFKDFATCGIAFKLSELLLKGKMIENLRQNFLELVAIGTIADMMPREAENKEMIAAGLSSLENSWRPGIQALFENKAFQEYQNLNQKVSKMISILNVRDLQQRLPASFRLLTAPSIIEAKKIIDKLVEKSKLRKERIEKITEEVEDYYPPEVPAAGRRAEGGLESALQSQPAHPKKDKKEEPIIFIGSPDWEFTLISPVASILCQKYKKPTFIFKKLEKESQGTVRVPAGINSVALMKKCQKYLITYGGHPQASGFRIKNENLAKFRDCMIKQLKSHAN